MTKVRKTGNQEPGLRMGPVARGKHVTSQDSDGSPRSSLARQTWLKMEGRSKAVELGEETEKEMGEKVRVWMQAENG